MNSININRQCKDYIRNEFPSQFDDDNSNWWGRGGNWWNRKLVLRSPGSRDFDSKGQIRYVLRYLDQQDMAYVELHISKDTDGEDFSDLLDELKQRCPDCDDFCWVGEDKETYRYNHPICGWNDAKQAFNAILAKTGELIERFFREEQAISRFEVSSMQLNLSGEEVNLETLSLHQMLSLKLHIPDYQRIYCWDEKILYTLWNDIQEISPNEKYRLGTIILQRVKNHFDIIDGQQRLVTLSLYLAELHTDGIPLLSERYQSRLAEEYIAYNKYVIGNLLSSVKRSSRRDIKEKILENIEFDVLILNDASLDLAYTFFSNENSRGKALSDFDLLKAHHLRFVIDNPKQSMHLAQKWDRMILRGDESSDESEKDYVRTLGIYIYRLRHWIRNSSGTEPIKYRIKQEYEAAPTIPEIPPFGERFLWNESIQGGAHFFGYVDSMLSKYKSFITTPAYTSIHGLDMETHCWYRDVIESLLFAYYLKFGESYLADALFLIAKRISCHRYLNQRVNLNKLLAYASDSGIVMMIDRATSPTFFLAELLQDVRRTGEIGPESKIQIRYRNLLNSQMQHCIDQVEIAAISNLYLS